MNLSCGSSSDPRCDLGKYFACELLSPIVKWGSWQWLIHSVGLFTDCSELCLNTVRACVLSQLSHAQLSVTFGTIALLSMGFLRQEYGSGLPFPSPGDIPDPGIKLASLMSPALAGRFFITEPPGKPYLFYT